MKPMKRFTAAWAAHKRAYRCAEHGHRERAWRRLRGLVNDQLRREVVSSGQEVQAERQEGQGRRLLTPAGARA